MTAAMKSKSTVVDLYDNVEKTERGRKGRKATPMEELILMARLVQGSDNDMRMLQRIVSKHGLDYDVVHQMESSISAAESSLKAACRLYLGESR